MLKQHTFTYQEEFPLESGKSLLGIELAYATYGDLNSNKDNVIWVCHALTANADFTEWWPGLFGKGRLFDPEKHFVVCANMLGSCYGSTGPLSQKPNTGIPYFHEFPGVTNRDIVQGFALLKKHLGIERINTLIGGSLGGQQALEWAITNPSDFENLILIATNAKHSAWGIAFNESQRQAIAMDLTWRLNTEKAGINGMKVARSIALLSYRHYDTYKNTQVEETNDKLDDFKASSYQRYQGEKLAKRFNAFSYWELSETMDSHNVGRNRGTVEEALGLVEANTLVISISNDILFPVQEQQFLNKYITKSSHSIIESQYGHDGFLIEAEQITQEIQNFYKKKEVNDVMIL